MIAVFRANTKNAAVLGKHLRTKGEARIKAQGTALPTVNPSDPDELDRMIDSNSPPPEYIQGQPSHSLQCVTQLRVKHPQLIRPQRQPRQAAAVVGGLAGERKASSLTSREARDSSMVIRLCHL
jgi:hypothetical protein